jgi:acyl dehydratase
MSGPVHWEDMAVGSVHEVGPVTVTREEILDFGRRFDPQPFHVDEEAARRTEFGGLVASGWHTCSLAMRMYVDAFLNRTVSAGSPGVEGIRWLRPVRPGDALRLRVEVLEARPSESRPHLGLVRARWRMVNQDGEPVMELTTWGMFGRRGA